jgi:hypothetical protein
MGPDLRIYCHLFYAIIVSGTTFEGTCHTRANLSPQLRVGQFGIDSFATKDFVRERVDAVGWHRFKAILYGRWQAKSQLDAELPEKCANPALWVGMIH